MSLYGQPPISLDMACLRMSELLMPSPSSTDITELLKLKIAHSSTFATIWRRYDNL